MVKRNSTVDFRFVCFTERSDGLDASIEARPLPYQLRGWWCKIPLFAPPMCIDNDQIIAIDLDVVITGNIDWLLNWRGNFMCLSMWHSSKYYNGSLWSLKPFTNQHVWENFASCADDVMKRCYSDQEYLNEQIPGAPTVNELFPGEVYGFNTHYWNLQPEERGKVNPSIWVFHGFPKPGEIYKKVEWVKEHWR
jgi:hypothetical protein